MRNRSKTKNLTYKIISGILSFIFSFTSVIPPSYAQVVMPGLMNLPMPGVMVPVSAGYAPALIKGITLNPENPLQFDFLVDRGESGVEGEELKEEANKLIKYFLASLTVPEDELWVNLSPYEEGRIISKNSGRRRWGETCWHRIIY